MPARPHVAIDATTISPGGKGASVYARSVLDALHGRTLDARVTVFARDAAAGPLEAAWPAFTVAPVRVRSTQLWHAWSLPRAVARAGADALHVLGEAAVGRVPVPYTMAVHELPHLRSRYTGGRPRDPYGRLSARWVERGVETACRRAAHVLALSESTARDVAGEYRVHPDRVTVAYPGVGAEFFAARGHSAARDVGLADGERYVLTFATGDARERPDAVVAAFAAVSRSWPHLLVVAGRCPPEQREHLTGLAAAAGCAERLRFAGFVAAEALPGLYAGAELFVELSRYEGFGLQVAEAMAAGACVVAARVASVPEIVGDAGVLVDPDTSVPLLASVVDDLLGSSRRTALAAAAPERARRFTWGACADVTAETIEACLAAVGARRRPGGAAPAAGALGR